MLHKSILYRILGGVNFKVICTKCGVQAKSLIHGDESISAPNPAADFNLLDS